MVTAVWSSGMIPVLSKSIYDFIKVPLELNNLHRRLRVRFPPRQFFILKINFRF